jgi:hypothetical protein
MILLGLILILLGAALGVLVYLAATPQTQTIELSEFGWKRDFGALELVVIGGAAVLLIWLGWVAMSAVMRRRARLRREEREQERYADLERTHNDYRTETERRFEDARVRDEDFARREEQIRTRQAEIELREDELARRETAWRDRQSPSVADVVTGRAEGRVSDGSAEWVDDGSTRPLDAPHGDPRVADQRVADQRIADQQVADQRIADQQVAEERARAAQATEEVRQDEPVRDPERPREARRSDPA